MPSNLAHMPAPLHSESDSPARRPRQPAAQPQPEKLFYSRREAAWTLSLSLRAITYMIADQRLTTRRYGRRVLIPAADIRRIAAVILRSDMLQGTGA